MTWWVIGPMTRLAFGPYTFAEAMQSAEQMTLPGGKPHITTRRAITTMPTRWLALR